MPLIKKDLYKVAGAEPGLWVYETPDAIATVVASGYFNNATNELKNGDIIFAVTGPNTGLRVLFVNSVTGAATVTTIAALQA